MFSCYPAGKWIFSLFSNKPYIYQLKIINEIGYLSTHFWLLYYFARECRVLGNLNLRRLFSHSPEGWKPKTKVLIKSGLVSPEASLLGLKTVAFLQCPCVVFSLFLCFPSASSSSYKDTSHTGLDSTFMTSLNPYCVSKALSPSSATWRIKSSKYELQGDTF